jgi:2-polyprenyl-6-methoxyphenol hydroxylase-like FAD-dependent oxidoreductase
MRFAINGAGIAGPTLAYWLRRFGHEPVLFEKAPHLRSGGYLIDSWGLGYELAERMGIISLVLDRSYRMKRMSMVDGNGAEVAGLELAPVRDRLEGRFVSDGGSWPSSTSHPQRSPGCARARAPARTALCWRRK